jgi:putative PEP-CTERM system histidine kinase
MEGASLLLHAAAALITLAWVGLILAFGRRRMALPHVLACLAASAWAGAIALGAPAPWVAVVEALRGGVWIGILAMLSVRFGDVRARPIALRFVWAGLAATGVSIAAAVWGFASLPTLGSPSLLGPLALSLLVVMAAENLYRNADDAVRWHVILPCIALTGLASFDVVLHSDAALNREYSAALLDARAVLTMLAMPLLAVASARDRRWKRSPPLSRPVVFHGATLIVAGTFLVGVGAVGEVLRHFDAEWTSAAQASLLAGAALVLLVAVSSRSIRSHARRLFADHFFAARFDYRREWLRCVATLSAHGADPQGRAIIAIADPVDSPAGLLLLRDPGEAGLHWAGSWNLPTTPLAIGPDHPLLAAMGEGGRISTELPPGLADTYGPLWIGVPLMHHREGLLGVVLLAPPRAPFRLDGEAFDLLRAVGREVAMFLAERRAAEHLHDQRRLHEYASRFAFVAHDVKTVGHQLSMLLTNAEDHMDDPEFREDMLLTVGASAKRIAALIARLRQPGDAPLPDGVTPNGETPDEATLDQSAPGIDAMPRVRALLPQLSHPVAIEGEAALAGVRLAIGADAFDSALRHLVDNAIEASPDGVPVRICLRRDGDRLVLDIIDRGEGMTPDFVRDTLFRPLISAKAGGSGIGAWQARDLLRGAGGDLVALSEPGVGTVMRLTIPCLDARPDSRAIAA